MFLIDFTTSESDFLNGDVETLLTETETLIKNKPARNNIISTLSFIITSFIFTPITIIYWASTWDIIYIYLFPNYFYLSYFASFLITNIILLISYLIQDSVQRLSDRLKTFSLSAGFFSFYNWNFLLKVCYAYFLTIGYVSQWRTYWDIYNKLTEGVSNVYFLGVSLLGILFYRYFLGRKLSSYTKTLPFQLTPDYNCDAFFIQGVFLNFENVSLFVLYFYQVAFKTVEHFYLAFCKK